MTHNEHPYSEKLLDITKRIVLSGHRTHDTLRNVRRHSDHLNHYPARAVLKIDDTKIELLTVSLLKHLFYCKSNIGNQRFRLILSKYVALNFKFFL